MGNEKYNSCVAGVPSGLEDDQEIRDLKTKCKLLQEVIKWQGGVDDYEPVVDDYLKYLKEV